MGEHEHGPGAERVEHGGKPAGLCGERVVGLGRPARETGPEWLDDDRPFPGHASTCIVSAAATTTYGCCGASPSIRESRDARRRATRPYSGHRPAYPCHSESDSR